MKNQLKLVSAVLLSVGLASPALAEVENRFYVGAKVGQVQFDTLDYSGLNYGILVGDQITINENHKVNIEGSYSQAKNDDTNLGTRLKIETYDIRTQYKYDFQLGENSSISPKVALAYENNKFKLDNGSSVKLARAYAELGVESKIGVTESFSITPSLAYQKDLYADTKDITVDDEKGDGYAVEVSFNKQFTETGSELAVAPYYKVYDNTALDGKLKQTGVKVAYTF